MSARTRAAEQAARERAREESLNLPSGWNAPSEGKLQHSACGWYGSRGSLLFGSDGLTYCCPRCGDSFGRSIDLGQNLVRIPYIHSSQPVKRLPAPPGLTPRWYGLKYHAEQYRLMHTSTARFRVVPAGRRSGKTELAKRYLTAAGLCSHSEANLFAAAPTWGQAKRIWWNDLVSLAPRHLVREYRQSQEACYIRFKNGVRIWVVGVDVPERMEGTPWDGGVLDEYGNARPDVWDEHLRPVFAERGGWCWFTGVPEGHNHYFDLYDKAERGALGIDWETFHWVSADILDPAEIAKAKRDMPADIFEQEFEARFSVARGRVYRDFTRETHTVKDLAKRYNPRAPLLVMLDFNVEPGAACIGQEMELPNGQRGTGIIGEVHIPYDSTTPAVCRKILADWEGHMGPVRVYGDATGGQRRTQGDNGTDWQLVRQCFHGKFDSVEYRVPDANPPEKDRVNDTNAWLKNALGEIRMMVDKERCPKTIVDFEGVRWLEGAVEIAKTGERNRNLTHWTDGIGYYVHEEHPIPDWSADGVRQHTLSLS